MSARFSDEHWMAHCLALAAHGAGMVSPNPLVGSVIVDADERVLGEGYHTRYGALHAEREAIGAAEVKHGSAVLCDATLFVNLEPCNHHGKTPPCTDIILEKGIPRVVVGMVDPFPQVAGSGIARLRANGVEVRVGILEHACKRLNEAFTHHIATGRPLVTLKMAQTLDGRIATRTGDSQWVTGLPERTLVHQWRATLDGVLVGANTARTDNPALTVRHVEGRQPIRVVLDRTGDLPAHLNLFSDAFAAHTLALVGPAADPAYADRLQRAGGRLATVPIVEGHLDLVAVLTHLGQTGGLDGRPLQSLLVEAGPGLATALLRQDLVDRFFLFIAPKLVGDGYPTLYELSITQMREAQTFVRSEWENIGDSMLFRGYQRAV